MLLSAFFAELNGVMRAIEIVFLNHWFNLWIETDCALVVLTFNVICCDFLGAKEHMEKL